VATNPAAKQRSQVSFLSIIQIMKANFLFFRDLFKIAPSLHALDGNFMNLNFAFACMIVVSFAIALGHA
jgi:hypothetical protein